MTREEASKIGTVFEKIVKAQSTFFEEGIELPPIWRLTEILYFFVAEYTKEMKVSEGGGLEEEQENIEVLELDFEKAYNMIYSGEIKDGKSIMLLQYAKIHNLMR